MAWHTGRTKARQFTVARKQKLERKESQHLLQEQPLHLPDLTNILPLRLTPYNLLLSNSATGPFGTRPFVGHCRAQQ